MSWLELVRHYFPKISDEKADYILWEYTGFPIFWNLTKEYPFPLARCRKQLRELKYRLKRLVIPVPEP